MVDAEPQYPFQAFNFSVEITVPGRPGPLCNGSFSECDGLELSMEIKTIREGGNNGRQVRLSGPVSFGQLSLKRGMTKDMALWEWFRESMRNPALRAEAHVVILESEQRDENVRRTFVLRNCLPMKLKAPALNARDGLLAIEEMQIAYESLELADLDERNEA